MVAQTTTPTELTPEFFKDKFDSLRKDYILFKAERLWLDALTPHQQGEAMIELVKMLSCINNSTVRDGYVKRIPKEVNNKIVDLKKNGQQPLPEKIEVSEIKKQLKELLKKQSDKQVEEKQKAKLQAEIQTAADAGLPDDFAGNKDDVWAALKYGIYVHDGVYYSRGGTRGDYPISNFTMKIIYHVDSSDDKAFRLISIENVYGFRCMVNINTDDFVGVGPFKKVIARRGDYVFKGNDVDLCRLQELLQKDETSAKRIEVLGWNNTNKFWAWSNGLTVLNNDGDITFLPVDEYGIVEHDGKRYFIPGCSMMYRDKEGMFANEKKFVYTEPLANFGFEDWARLMYGAYDAKAIPAILFYIGSIFRDVIFAKNRRFPLLNLFGPPGAGKGEVNDSLMVMFGQKQDQIMLGGASTVVGVMRKFSQLKNAMVGLDEYKNNLLPKVIESLKNLYDGIGYERGKMTNDYTTESTPISSSTILSGQDMPTIEPALFMRCIMLSFEEGKFSDRQRSNFQKLKNDYEPHGLSYITAHLLKFRPVFEDSYKEEYGRVFKQTRQDVSNVEIEDRMIMNISILLTIMHLTKDALDYPFTYGEAKAWLIDNMIMQHDILRSSDENSKFWQIFEFLAITNVLRNGVDYLVKDNYLYLRPVTVIPAYEKECNSRREQAMSKHTLLHYLKMDKGVFVPYYKDGKEGERGVRFDIGTKVCLAFNYNKLKIRVVPGDDGEESPTEQQHATTPEIEKREDLPF